LPEQRCSFTFSGSIMLSPSYTRQAGALMAIWLMLCLMMLGL
jgi:hypothetical protein